MKKPDYIPADYPLVQVVDSMEELLERPFGPGVNMFVLPRRLKGDFNALARHLGGWAAYPDKYMFEGAAGNAPGPAREAARAVFEDMALHSARGDMSELRVIPETGYVFEPRPEGWRENAYLPHADRAPGQKGVVFHHYTASTTLHLRAEDAVRCIDLPGLRAEFTQAWERQKEKKESLDAFLENTCGAWYLANPRARPFRLMPGDVSRHAGAGNAFGAPPNVHYAPREEKGAPPRLLLVR